MVRGPGATIQAGEQMAEGGEDLGPEETGTELVYQPREGRDKLIHGTGLLPGETRGSRSKPHRIPNDPGGLCSFVYTLSDQVRNSSLCLCGEAILCFSAGMAEAGSVSFPLIMRSGVRRLGLFAHLMQSIVGGRRS